MHFMDSIIRFIKDEEGAAAIEYALVAVMVAVVIGTFVPGINEKITEVFTGIEAGFPPPPAP